MVGKAVMSAESLQSRVEQLLRVKTLIRRALEETREERRRREKEGEAENDETKTNNSIRNEKELVGGTQGRGSEDGSLTSAQFIRLLQEERGACRWRDAVQLGDLLSDTLFAPPAWRPPPPSSNWQWQPPQRLMGGFPPAPQPENMQKGKLGEWSARFTLREANSTSQGSEKKEKMTVERKEEAKDHKTSEETRQVGADFRQAPLKRPRPSSPPPVSSAATSSAAKNIREPDQEKERRDSPVAEVEKIVPRSSPAEQRAAAGSSNKKARAISINFGFESDSDEDSDE